MALSQIQTNQRFLHPTQQRYLAKLLNTFPNDLDTVYLVNSGSEANDLALRIARAYSTASNPEDVIVLDGAYHGHTSTLIDISPYKWSQAKDRSSKNYKKDYVHVVCCPDPYQGKHVGETEDVGKLYALEVEAVVEKTGGVGCFIAEGAMGCGGQILLPPSYLKHCYAAVRSKGGVCIADEVNAIFSPTNNLHLFASLTKFLSSTLILKLTIDTRCRLGSVDLGHTSGCSKCMTSSLTLSLSGNQWGMDTPFRLWFADALLQMPLPAVVRLRI